MNDHIEKDNGGFERVHWGQYGVKIEVAPIDEKMRENHLKWFVHVERRVINASVKKSDLIQVEGTKKVEENLK